MSMFSAPGRRNDQVGETVASFPTYEAAQKAVSTLIAGDIPARQIAIVGQTLRSIERVTGKLGYATAARSGAINGMLLGLFFSAILVLGSPEVPIQAFIGVVFVGIAIGMLFSLITYSFVRRRRDYASVMQVVADHYEVTVERDSVAKARQLLGPQSEPSRPAAPEPRSPDHDAEPPRYGQRIPPVTEEPPRYGQRITPGATAPAADPAPGPPADAAPATDVAPGPEAPADDDAPPPPGERPTVAGQAPAGAAPDDPAPGDPTGR